MKERRRDCILSTIGAVSCVVSMILSVTVLPAIAYANVTKNPLFAAVLAAACVTLFAGKRRGVLRHCNK